MQVVEQNENENGQNINAIIRVRHDCVVYKRIARLSELSAGVLLRSSSVILEHAITDHSRGIIHSIQDISIRRSSSVVQNIRSRDLYRATIGGKATHRTQSGSEEVQQQEWHCCARLEL